MKWRGISFINERIWLNGVLNYYPTELQKDDNAPKISKYAYGTDYHFVIKDKLKSVDQSSLVDRVENNLIEYLMENDFKEQDSKDNDWGQPPSPLTPENQKKAFRAQIILGIVSLIGITLPGILFWLLGWKYENCEKQLYHDVEKKERFL